MRFADIRSIRDIQYKNYIIFFFCTQCLLSSILLCSTTFPRHVQWGYHLRNHRRAYSFDIRFVFRGDHSSPNCAQSTVLKCGLTPYGARVSAAHKRAHFARNVAIKEGTVAFLRFHTDAAVPFLCASHRTVKLLIKSHSGTASSRIAHQNDCFAWNLRKKCMRLQKTDRCICGKTPSIMNIDKVGRPVNTIGREQSFHRHNPRGVERNLGMAKCC